MNKSSSKILLISVLLITYSTFSQNQNKTVEFKSFKEFEQSIRNHKQDTSTALNYAKVWLTVAKKQRNLEQQAKAYKHIMHLVEKKYRMIYADSLLLSAMATYDNILIGNAYLTIGAALYNNRELVKALDNYLLANNYISKTNDTYAIYKVKYTIAQTKYHLGFYEEAIDLFSECLQFFKDENSTAYLTSLHGLALCYNKIERHDLCAFNNQLGLQLSKQLELPKLVPYFKNSEGINNYNLGNYTEAISLLKESFKAFEKSKDEAYQIVTWSYLGKCYWAQNKKDIAVGYFHKVMHTIEKNNFIRPDLRDTFELLIAYYAEKKDLKNQLKTIEKLLSYDTQLNNNYKYLSYKIHKEYDTKSLIQKKQKIKEELESNKIHYIGIITLLSVLVFVIYSYHLFTKKIQRQKFDSIMNKLNHNKKDEVNINNPVTTISPEVTKEVLQNLEKFEANKKFIEKDMTLTKLATQLNTNTKYASLIIAHHRGKKTTSYINDLKIDFIVEVLVNNNKFRNYTNKALAEEAGFGSTQIFTQCFKNKIGMSPTAFIHQLNTSKNNKST